MYQRLIIVFSSSLLAVSIVDHPYESTSEEHDAEDTNDAEYVNQSSHSLDLLCSLNFCIHYNAN